MRASVVPTALGDLSHCPAAEAAGYFQSPLRGCSSVECGPSEGAGAHRSKGAATQELNEGRAYGLTEKAYT